MTDPRSPVRQGSRRVFAAVAFVLVAAFGALPAAGETPTDVIRDLNEARRANGLPALVTDANVTRAAADHVADMVERGYVDVTAPGGTDAGAWLQRAGVRTPQFGAVAVSGLPDRLTLSTALRRSPALAELLKAPGEVRIGIGHHGEMFRLSDGRVTAEAWSVIVARPVPPAVVDAVPVLLLEINRARAGKGAAPVRLNPKLMQAALMQADDMAERDYIGHARHGGPRLVDRVRTAGYSFSRVAENMAAGQGSARAAVEAWDSSPGHARTLYAAEYDEVGLAYRPGPISQGTVAVPHVWVAVFGAR